MNERMDKRMGIFAETNVFVRNETPINLSCGAASILSASCSCCFLLRRDKNFALSRLNLHHHNQHGRRDPRVVQGRSPQSQDEGTKPWLDPTAPEKHVDQSQWFKICH